MTTSDLKCTSAGLPCPFSSVANLFSSSCKSTRCAKYHGEPYLAATSPSVVPTWKRSSVLALARKLDLTVTNLAPSGFKPQASRARDAFGGTWMAAPISLLKEDRSYICTVWPARRIDIAAENPAMPAPTIMTFRVIEPEVYAAKVSKQMRVLVPTGLCCRAGEIERRQYGFLNFKHLVHDAPRGLCCVAYRESKPAARSCGVAYIQLKSLEELVIFRMRDALG